MSTFFKKVFSESIQESEIKMEKYCNFKTVCSKWIKKIGPYLRNKNGFINVSSWWATLIKDRTQEIELNPKMYTHELPNKNKIKSEENILF